MPETGAMIVLSAIMFASGACATTASKESPAMEWKGSFCETSRPSHRTVENQAEWERLWLEIGRPAPPVDFSRYFSAAVFLGEKPTAGYEAVFEDPVVREGRTVVFYRVQEPEGFVAQVITRPYAVKLFPKNPAALATEVLPR